MNEKALKAGLAAAKGTGQVLAAAPGLMLSGPAVNLGGYAVAQTVAGTVGLGGPALSVAIAAVGGPVVVGAVIVTGVGALVYGLVSLFD